MTPAFMDEHSTVVAAPRATVWEAVHRYARAMADADRRALARVLRTEPGSGFELAEEVPGHELTLVGRHRFAHYRLVFALEETGDRTTELMIRSYSDFLGRSGALYRAGLIGTRGHVAAVRRMLRGIRRDSEQPSG